MKCIPTKKLFLYVEDRITSQERDIIEKHIEHCSKCNQIVLSHTKEIHVLKMKPAPLPASFTQAVLDQLEPYPLEKKRQREKYLPKSNRWKALSLSLGALFLIFTVGSYASDGVAYSLFHSLFSRGVSDEGMGAVTQEQLIEEPDLSIEDQGVIFTVEEVYADPTRIALYYSLTDSRNKGLNKEIEVSYGAIQADESNRIYLTDQAGNDLLELSQIKMDDSYGLLQFDLYEQVPEETVVHIELNQIGAKQGNWSLQIPINMKATNQITTVTKIDEYFASEHGVTVQLNELTFAPSLTNLQVDVQLDEGKKKEITQLIEQKTLPAEALRWYETDLFHGHDIEFSIVDSKQSVLAQVARTRVQNNNVNLISRYQDTYSFNPIRSTEKLKFILDAIYTTEPIELSISFTPEELKTDPIVEEFEQNIITVKDFKTKKVQGQLVGEIAFEEKITEDSPELLNWTITDEAGNVYVGFVSGSLKLDKAAENHVYDNTMEFYGLEQRPKALTMTANVIRYKNTDIDWEVLINE